MYCKTIRGEVVDSLGLPVPFSTIVVDHSQKIGTTNKYGRFVLEDVSSDKCLLTVSNIGYETKHIIVPQGDDDLFLQISLKEQVVQLADVDVVYGDITSLILKKMENVKMLREQLPAFEAVAECQITSIGNLKEFPSPDFVIAYPKKYKSYNFSRQECKKQGFSRIGGRACYFTRLFARLPKQQKQPLIIKHLQTYFEKVTKSGKSSLLISAAY